MRLKRLTMFGLVLALNAPVDAGLFNTIKPQKAVMRAAAAGPLGVSGVFEMRVRATGHAGGHFFLNSETDYRDPRNLSIAMDERTATALRERLGATSDDVFIGRKIFVRGTAFKVKVWFIDDAGRATDKYYYQTHVPITDAVQVSVRDKL